MTAVNPRRGAARNIGTHDAGLSCQEAASTKREGLVKSARGAILHVNRLRGPDAAGPLRKLEGRRAGPAAAPLFVR